MSDSDPYRFKLYVAGKTTIGSLRAIANFRRIGQSLPENYTLEVIDIFQEPDRALADRIVATPTLIKDAPPPRFKIVGDLSTRMAQLDELLNLSGDA